MNAIVHAASGMAPEAAHHGAVPLLSDAGRSTLSGNHIYPKST
jgi:hypothetical protein